MKLTIPCAYQGGKQRIADKILDIIKPDASVPFVDLCCGTGAVSIALVKRGYPAYRISMIDNGLWGAFWQAIGDKNFDLDVFRAMIDDIPPDPSDIQAHMQSLSKQPLDDKAIYTYLILQASSFGGRAIWATDGYWQSNSFRNYWLPTATSSRRYPVNPMMPMPNTLYDRVKLIWRKMGGLISAKQADIADVKIQGACIYIDPPYSGTSGYATNFDVVEHASRLAQDNTVFVSESKPLTDTSWQVSGSRSKGNMRGAGKGVEEWLSKF